jgi:hypothetical protein
VSDDYNKGYRGTLRDENTDEAEYRRGQIAFAAANPSGKMLNTAGVERSSRAFRGAWDQNPNAALGEMIRQLVKYTLVTFLVVGSVAFVALVMLGGDLKTAIYPGIWAASAVFFISGIQAVAMLAGSLVNGKSTGRGVLFLLILLFALWSLCSNAAAQLTR